MTLNYENPVSLSLAVLPYGRRKIIGGLGNIHPAKNADIKTGYADADQLDLCYPLPEDDPVNHRVNRSTLALSTATSVMLVLVALSSLEA
jgi:hypothetical protein